MKIEKYDITKLIEDEKSDFENILNYVNNYINQEFEHYEFSNKLEELGIDRRLIGIDEEDDTNYFKFLLRKLFELKNEIIKNYLNIYKKDDLKKNK